MQSNKDPGHLRRVKKVAYKLNLPEEVIEETLRLTSEYIKDKISKVEVSEEVLMTEEEFKKQLPIIKIPSMGYLKPSYHKYKAIHNKSKIAKAKKLKESNE